MKKIILNWKLSLVILLLVGVSIFGYILIKGNKENNEDKNSLKTQVVGIEEIKEKLIELIPEEYQVIEDEYEVSSEENNGCVSLYTIYPKEYSEIQKKYLDDAGLMYCEDINNVILRGQVGQVKYNKEEKRWTYGYYEDPVDYLDQKQYGENLVSIAQLGGSHVFYNYYIVRLKNTDELIILSIPISNRIRCDSFKDGIEVVEEDCVDFITSMGMSPNSSEFFPDEVYEKDYNDLLEILNNI